MPTNQSVVDPGGTMAVCAALVGRSVARRGGSSPEKASDTSTIIANVTIRDSAPKFALAMLVRLKNIISLKE